MEIIDLVNAYRQEPALEKKVELARLLYDDVKGDLGRVHFHKVPPSLMEDVLQDALIAIFKHLGIFRGKTSLEFRAWCNTIFNRKRIDLYRKGLTRMESLPPEELWAKLEQSAAVSPISSQERLDLEAAMTLLEKSKPGCRQLLLKRYVIGLKPHQMANEIRLKSDVVRMRIDRCLKKMRGLM